MGAVGQAKLTINAAPAPAYVWLIKALLYAFSLCLYLRPLSSVGGIISAVVFACGAIALAELAQRERLRTAAALILVPCTILLGLALGQRLLSWQWVSRLLNVEATFLGSDVLTFGLAALCCVFLLRLLPQRLHAFSLAEVLFVAGSVAVTMADHRNRMLSRPRFLSDWAWSLGYDPTSVLIAIGAAAVLLAVLLFLRNQPLSKLLLSLVLMLGLGLLYYSFGSHQIEASDSSDVLGLTGKKGKGDKQRSGQGGGQGEKGDGDGPFKDNYDSSTPPTPVAIALLRDDYETSDGVLYFRQRVLSTFNGHHLVADPDWDGDVLDEMPDDAPSVAPAGQSEDHHIVVPTTMYLLVDHPQPPALTHARKLTLVENPNPNQFVAAYDVESLVLSVPTLRLLGRSSIPANWDAAKRAHYLALPDDPRYRALADIVVRQVDPRFADDDLAKAFAIKRHLEKQGFYTLRSKHSDKKDPTASFLFGSLRGYCVHFAHAAVYLLRSQGVAARVALGYAVQTTKRGGGSSILIMGNRAHAWPEVHLDGVGWVTLDVYPEQTDMPPPAPVDHDLEKLLGELARNDPTGGVSPSGKPLIVPWAQIGRLALFVIVLALLLAYLIKLYRGYGARWLTTGPRHCRVVYRAALDRLADVGLARRRGETRERHARRVSAISPSFSQLTTLHLAHALGPNRPPTTEQFQELLSMVWKDLSKNVHPLRRTLGQLNPFGWIWTR